MTTDTGRTVTRFAPSPTGSMHIGNLRTALYAYLIARKENGTFILRIEDTDRKREVEGAIGIIKNTLRTTGLFWDEGPDTGGSSGPYIQSERKDIYIEYAKHLIALGGAYYCFCESGMSSASEDLSGDAHDVCRSLDEKEAEERASSGGMFVIRQKMPSSGQTSYHDAVFGEITVDNAELEDQVLIKSDGYPTYNFAHVVDDHLMGVTHVVRGSEYVISTPKYALLYDAFGWERPVYIHLPLIMGQDENGEISKLSKRHGSVSFASLSEDGYLPEAIINYIALLGWSPGTNEEIFSLRDLENVFDITGISKSQAIFDYKKLSWFNGEYIRKLTEETFYELSLPYLKKAIPSCAAKDKAARLIQGRIDFLAQIEERVAFIEKQPAYQADLFVNKKAKTDLDIAKTVIDTVLREWDSLKDFTNEALFAYMSELSERLSVKLNTVAWILRIAVSGLAATPGGATELMEVIGKEICFKRLQAAGTLIDASSAGGAE